MARQNPSVGVSNSLKVVASPVNTRVHVAKPELNFSEEESLLMTAEAIKGFSGSAKIVNDIMLEEATKTAREEYYKNQGDWKKWSDKHPFLSHLNPHIEGAFNKAKAQTEIDKKITSFISQTKNRPDIDEDTYYKTLEQTKGEIFSIANEYGVSPFDIENEILPKVNQFEQNSKAAYQQNRSKYKYETVKADYGNKITQTITTLNKNKNLKPSEKVEQLNNLITEARTYLNPLDTSDIVQTSIQTIMLDNLENMSFHPEELKAIADSLQMDGKSFAEHDMSFSLNMDKLVKSFNTSRLQALANREELENFQKKQKRKEIESKAFNDFTYAALKGNFGEFQNLYKNTLKMATKLGLQEEALPMLQNVMTYARMLSGTIKDYETDNDTFLSYHLQALDGKASVKEILASPLLSAQDKKELITLNYSSEERNKKEGKLKYLGRQMAYDFSAFDSGLDGLIPGDLSPHKKAIAKGLKAKYKAEWDQQRSALTVNAQLSESTEPIVKARESLLKRFRDELIINGIKAQEFIKPADGEKTSNFGEQRVGHKHGGIDIANIKPGTPVRASASGQIIDVGTDSTRGNYVVLRHPNGFTTHYYHLAKPISKSLKGSYVQQGKMIGLMGNTGRSTGQHVHFEIRDKNNTQLDPMTFLKG